MNFACPSCHITLQAEPELAGKTVKCPGCSTKIQIPASFGETHAESEGEELAENYYNYLPELNVSGAPAGPHPSTVSVWLGGAIGIGATFLWYLIMFMLPKVEPGYCRHRRISPSALLRARINAVCHNLAHVLVLYSSFEWINIRNSAAPC